MRRPILSGVVLVSGVLLASGAHAQVNRPAVPLYDNLGDHHYQITTAEPRAQRYFDQGLRLYYAFNHAEAIRAFQEAARLDPSCGMCYWGIAASWGPNINAPIDSAASVAAYEAVQRARAQSDHLTAREQGLIAALSERYEAVPPRERAPLDSAYARAMKGVVDRHPGDLEAKALLAEALMDLSPWYYWNPDGSARPQTPEILDQLERVLKTRPNHPGANHFYIHAVEAVQPERAVAAAERLADLMPGAGHLVHMPGHIYIRVGRYEDAIAANEHAVHADETYISDHNPAVNMYTVGYYPHNYDFLAFAASMIGREKQAIGSADKVAELIPAEMLGLPGFTVLQHLASRPMQMRVRFGRWNEILDVPAPNADLKYMTAIWNYARGRALAATGDLRAAKDELASLRAVADSPELAAAVANFNPVKAVLGIATDVLAGHIAWAAGDHAEAVTRMRAAAAVEDGLVYGEPPEWTVPVRQDLGLLLLDADRPGEAAQAFREDLGRFPRNRWSMEGAEAAARAMR